ncbi:alpha/beta fold hydrolase [Nocardioides flavescens]|uniref:Alpha/beta fold hydrolase n=1 Tax=Nocardioides flavescens TaxID=2691959 RepID=A0A6L7ERR2_9ACTN|nr:alpha/beta hydrolase [Nocardioides flavescens]MXG89370.1 alpha/beta fold hydrolase [Nocardioides flavescens]
MSLRGRIIGAAAGATGLAAGAAVVGVRRQRRAISGRPGDSTPFGSLRAEPLTVVADDGVPLHVEVDEPDRAQQPGDLTVVFCHGYALDLDCWHFQRAALRGRVRTVFWDQRSHGRSGRTDSEHATIDQLGRDLLAVLDAVVPEGPVVLVGHSMGGMTIIAFTEQHPELVGERIVGVGLLSTTAGGLDPSRVLLPLVPARLGGELTGRAIRALARGHRVVDGVRRAGRSVAMVATDLFAFGDDVPAGYVEFVDEMLSATSFETVAAFFPSFESLDKFDAVEVLSRVPTTIICGTDDRLTSIGHSRKLHARIHGSELLECEGAGHMVLLERHADVDAALEALLDAARERVVA